MLLSIAPVTVAGVECSALDVSLAASSSVAITAIPLDADGAPIPGHVLSVVLGSTDPRVAELLDGLAAVVAPLLGDKAAGGFTAVAVPEPVPALSKDELDAQARQAMLAATAALDAAKAAYEAAAIEIGDVVEVKKG